MKRPPVFDLTAQHLDRDARVVAAAERLATALDGLLRSAARAEGVSPLQARTLVLLLQRGHQAPRAGELARAFDVTPPTVSDAVAALTAKRLVRREREGGDARAASLRLTPAGRAAARRLSAWAEPARSALEGVASADKQATLDALTAWLAALQRAGIVSVARMCVTCRFFVRDAHPGARASHHCRLLDLPLAASELRVDCPEHQAA